MSVEAKGVTFPPADILVQAIYSASAFRPRVGARLWRAGCTPIIMCLVDDLLVDLKPGCA